MAKKKVDIAEEPQAQPQALPEAAPQTTEASVYAAGGGHIRTYTRAVHGDNFQDLAAEMAAHHAGSRVEVR